LATCGPAGKDPTSPFADVYRVIGSTNAGEDLEFVRLVLALMRLQRSTRLSSSAQRQSTAMILPISFLIA